MAAFVLIPGAGGQAWYWHRVVPLLESARHTAHAVELPAADETAGLAAYTDIVVEAIGLRRRDLVIVGQSMGALTAPLVCTKVPARLMVLLNAMIPSPGETGGKWWTNSGQGAAAAEKARREGRDPGGKFDPSEIFLHDVPADVMATASEEPAQSGRPFDDPWPLTEWPHVPTRVISAADDRLFPVEFQRRLVEERLGITPDVIPGGHLSALARPDELTALLLSYLE
jgi:pimeloyl-ACP methyl ester carboxylesterase